MSSSQMCAAAAAAGDRRALLLLQRTQEGCRDGAKDDAAANHSSRWAIEHGTQRGYSSLRWILHKAFLTVVGFKDVCHC